MASGHVNRIYRPNTWLHRPMLQNVKISLANPEPSTHGTFRTWPDVRLESAFGGRADVICSERVFPVWTRSGHPTTVPVEPSKHPTLPKPQRTLTYIKVRCGRARANLGHRHLCRDHRPAARRASVPVEETHYGRFEKWAVNKVPIGRYMAFVGSLLLAMFVHRRLVTADWPNSERHQWGSEQAANQDKIRSRS